MWPADLAEHWREAGGGVIFVTDAAPATILLTREDEGHYDEGEVVIDPFALRRVRTLELLR
jgi:hypothetical protein